MVQNKISRASLEQYKKTLENLEVPLRRTQKQSLKDYKLSDFMPQNEFDNENKAIF